MILQRSTLTVKYHKFISRIFYFNSENMKMSGYSELGNKIDDNNDFINSTSCFQTKNEYIECTFIKQIEFNSLSVGIYKANLDYIKTIFLDEVNINAFTKIFHIKKEIGAYIYFKKDIDLPYIQIKKLNSNSELVNMFNFDYIILNGNQKYSINTGLFYSDGMKIIDNKFIVILTSTDLLNLIICIFDIYNDDTALRLRYYKLGLEQFNIKININIRGFIFRNLFGVVFYNSNLQYPGYFIFNYTNINNNNSKKINETTIELKLFSNTSYNYFDFSENMELNNILSEKFRIISFIILMIRLQLKIKIVKLLIMN